jgi:hypothetical protein
MARLTIDQIDAPDLRASADILAESGKSFQNAVTSASDLLSKYQEGQMSKGDAEITNLLAGAKNEEEWNKILTSTDFSKMNLSPEMRANILNRRDSILGYETSRAGNLLTAAQTGNTNATADRTRNSMRIDSLQENRDQDIHGVTMKDHDWRINAREEDAGLASAALAAAMEGRTHGYNGGGGPVAQAPGAAAPGTNLGPRADGSGINQPASNGMEGRFMAAVQQGGVTNPFGLAAIAATGRHESGFSAQNGGRTWNDPSESGRPGTAGGYMSWNNDRLQAMQQFTGGDASPEAQAAYLLQEDPELIQKLNNASSVEEATALMNNAWRFAGYDRPGGEAAARLETARSLVGNYGGSTQPNARARVTENPNQGGSAQQAYLAGLANTQFQSTADVLSAYTNQYDQNQIGQEAIDAADSKAADESLAQAIIDAGKNNIDPTQAVVDFRRSNPGATAQEVLKNEAKVLEATGDGGALSAAQLQIDTTGASPEDVETATSTVQVIQENLRRDPYNVALIGSEEFEANPVEQMVSALEGLGISSKPSDVESAINSLAEREGITRGQAAYSYARAAETEWKIGRALGVFGDNLSNVEAAKFARENFKGDRAQQARTAVAEARRQAERVQKAADDLGKLERQIQKIAQSGDTPPADLIFRRDSAKTSLNRLWDELGYGSPEQGQPEPAPRDAASVLANSLGSEPPGMRNPDPQPGWNNYLFQ